MLKYCFDFVVTGPVRRYILYSFYNVHLLPFSSSACKLLIFVALQSWTTVAKGREGDWITLHRLHWHQHPAPDPSIIPPVLSVVILCCELTQQPPVGFRWFLLAYSTERVTQLCTAPSWTYYQYSQPSFLGWLKALFE